GARPVDVAFSPDGRYFAAAIGVAPYVVIYRVNVSTGAFTKLANPGTLPTAAGTSVAFERKGRYLAVGLNNRTDSLLVYRIDPGADSFTAISPGNGTNASVDANALGFSRRQNVIMQGENMAGSAESERFIPIGEHFWLPPTNGLPAQPAASKAI